MRDSRLIVLDRKEGQGPRDVTEMLYTEQRCTLGEYKHNIAAVDHMELSSLLKCFFPLRTALSRR